MAKKFIKDKISTFKGASKRLEKIAQSESSVIFKDFAHSPSKVEATTNAVKNQYGKRRLLACLELHTYSSLNADFLKEYAGAYTHEPIFCKKGDILVSLASVKYFRKVGDMFKVHKTTSNSFFYTKQTSSSIFKEWRHATNKERLAFENDGVTNITNITNIKFSKYKPGDILVSLSSVTNFRHVGDMFKVIKLMNTQNGFYYSLDTCSTDFSKWRLATASERLAFKNHNITNVRDIKENNEIFVHALNPKLSCINNSIHRNQRVRLVKRSTSDFGSEDVLDKFKGTVITISGNYTSTFNGNIYVKEATFLLKKESLEFLTLDKFPESGFCMTQSKLLSNVLMNTREQKESLLTNSRGFAWDSTNYWNISYSTGTEPFSIEQLKPFLGIEGLKPLSKPVELSKAIYKYKIGDKVRMLDGKDTDGGWVGSMDKYIGKIGKVTKIPCSTHSRWQILVDGRSWYYTESSFELYQEEEVCSLPEEWVSAVIVKASKYPSNELREPVKW